MIMTSKTKKTIEKAEPMFPKEQILSANKYRNRKDILGELLDDGKEYSFKQVDDLMDKFMKGKVK